MMGGVNMMRKKIASGLNNKLSVSRFVPVCILSEVSELVRNESDTLIYIDYNLIDHFVSCQRV